MKNAHLYIDCQLDSHECESYCTFLQEFTQCQTEACLFSALIENESTQQRLARKFAEIRITQLGSQEPDDTVFPIEIEYEKKHLMNPDKPSQCFYNGLEFQYILRQEWSSLFEQTATLRILLTDKKLMTWENDSRYHLRTIILGYPSIISRIGIVEAPAKPKEYYLLKHMGTLQEQHAWLSENRHRFLELGDPRMKEVMKGYLLQCYCYWAHLSNDFCKDPGCALFNSHWQEEVLNAQFYHRLCEKHQLDKKSLS